MTQEEALVADLAYVGHVVAETSNIVRTTKQATSSVKLIINNL